MNDTHLTSETEKGKKETEKLLVTSLRSGWVMASEFVDEWQTDVMRTWSWWVNGNCWMSGRKLCRVVILVLQIGVVVAGAITGRGRLLKWLIGRRMSRVASVGWLNGRNAIRLFQVRCTIGNVALHLARLWSYWHWRRPAMQLVLYNYILYTDWFHSNLSPVLSFF